MEFINNLGNKCICPEEKVVILSEIYNSRTQILELISVIQDQKDVKNKANGSVSRNFSEIFNFFLIKF